MSYLLILVGILICVAFIVLLERKVLGYIQLRKGPNRVGLSGILQSFRDAIKLFTREQVIPSFSNILPFYISPVFMFIVVLFIWLTFPQQRGFINLEFRGLLFFCCTSLGVYGLILRGWSSNSNYAILGAIRGVAQTISYEVALAFLFLSLALLVGRLNFTKFIEVQRGVNFVVLAFPLLLMWVASIIAETNRTPFDFAEGESELVSGFNIEYGRGGFALLFLAEYARIIFMRYLVVVIFLGGLRNLLVLNIYGIVFCFIFIWVRGMLPRLRYDGLIILTWKRFLPNSLSMFAYIIVVCFIV